MPGRSRLAAGSVIPDGVVFDVDGVLVDVRGSFLAAVAGTVQWLFTRRYGLIDDGPLVDDGVLAAFHRAPGYNNDEDKSYALALFYRAALGPETRSTAELRRAAGDPREAARSSLHDHQARVKGLEIATFEQDVVAAFRELYWGSDRAARLFGITPRLVNRAPLVERERVLLRADTVAELRGLGVGKFGVITGRLRVEWDAIRESLPLPAETLVLTDEDGRKPDPALLARLVARMGMAYPCYVGDVVDDWAFVFAYNASPSGVARPALGVLVCGETEERALRQAGATLFVRDVNGLPRLLRSLVPG